MALSENDAAPHNKRGQSPATYAESGHLRNALGNPFANRERDHSFRYSNASESNRYGSAAYAGPGHQWNEQASPFANRGRGDHSYRYLNASESNGGYGSAAYAGPGHQGNAEESGVGSDEDNFDFLDARASVRAQKSSHGRNSVRAPKAPRHNDDLIAMYALIFPLIEAKIPEEIAIDEIKKRFPNSQEKAITLYNEFKSEENKKDPKGKAKKYTHKQLGQARALLQDFKEKLATLEEYRKRVVPFPNLSI